MVRACTSVGAEREADPDDAELLDSSIHIADSISIPPPSSPPTPTTTRPPGPTHQFSSFALSAHLTTPTLRLVHLPSYIRIELVAIPGFPESGPTRKWYTGHGTTAGDVIEGVVELMGVRKVIPGAVGRLEFILLTPNGPSQPRSVSIQTQKLIPRNERQAHHWPTLPASRPSTHPRRSPSRSPTNLSRNSARRPRRPRTRPAGAPRASSARSGPRPRPSRLDPIPTTKNRNRRSSCAQLHRRSTPPLDSRRSSLRGTLPRRRNLQRGLGSSRSPLRSVKTREGSRAGRPGWAGSSTSRSSWRRKRAGWNSNSRGSWCAFRSTFVS